MGLAKSAPLGAWAEGKERWLAAMRWRRQIEELLQPFELTFARWLVLEATDELVREQDEPVTQSAVAARCELDKMTVSQVMRTLTERGLVDRGPAFGRPAYRLLLTPAGKKIAAKVRARLQADSPGRPKAAR